MSYGHAERNLTFLRQLEAETMQLLGRADQLNPEQSAWLQEIRNPDNAAAICDVPPTDRLSGPVGRRARRRGESAKAGAKRGSHSPQS